MSIFNEEYLAEKSDLITIPKWILTNNITTPQKLCDFIVNNIEVKETPTLQNPRETITLGYGDGNDHAALVDAGLKVLGYHSYRIILVEFKEWKKTLGKIHTICYYEDNKKKGHWVETAWEKEIGIHKEDKFPPVGIFWQAYKAWEWTPGFENLLMEEIMIKEAPYGISKHDYAIAQFPQYKMDIWRKDPTKKREDRR